MPYIPDWEPLSAAVNRIMASGVEESEAKADLCNAIADQKISVRVTRARGKGVYSGGNVRPPVHLEPDDMDWDNSRPNAYWSIGPMLGQYGWLDDWEEKQIGRVEVSTADVLDTLCTPRDGREDVLKLSPDTTGELKGGPIEELGTSNPLFSEARGSAPAPDARRPRMSIRDIQTKLPTFLKDLQAKSQQNREPFNQEIALAAARDHFNR
jgi:hypothetical protein